MQMKKECEGVFLRVRRYRLFSSRLFSQGKQLICGFWILWKIYLWLSQWILSVHRPVCPVQAFMNISTSNINGRVEIYLFYHSRPTEIRVFLECGVFAVPGFQLFFTRKQLIYGVGILWNI